MYDNNNIFAKILRGEISCEKVFENQLFQGNNRISLDRLSSGMYFYSISSNEVIIKTKKLILK